MLSIKVFVIEVIQYHKIVVGGSSSNFKKWILYTHNKNNLLFPNLFHQMIHNIDIKINWSYFYYKFQQKLIHADAVCRSFY